MPDSPQLWVGTSWKMNKTLAEAQAFAEALVAADVLFIFQLVPTQRCGLSDICELPNYLSA